MASIPRMLIVPLVGAIRVVSSFIVVVFPAQFGPKKPKILPEFTERSIPSTAIIDPYVLESEFATIQDIKERFIALLI